MVSRRSVRRCKVILCWSTQARPSRDRIANIFTQQQRRPVTGNAAYWQSAMAPGFYGRIVQWLANEVIVKGLSNNPAFQRFALRTSQQAKELSKSAAEAAKNMSEAEGVVQLRKVRSALYSFCWQ